MERGRIPFPTASAPYGEKRLTTCDSASEPGNDIDHLCLLLKWPYNRLQMVRLVVQVRPDHILSSGADRHAVGRFVSWRRRRGSATSRRIPVSDPLAILDVTGRLLEWLTQFSFTNEHRASVATRSGRTRRRPRQLRRFISPTAASAAPERGEHVRDVAAPSHGHQPPMAAMRSRVMFAISGQRSRPAPSEAK